MTGVLTPMMILGTIVNASILFELWRGGSADWWIPAVGLAGAALYFAVSAIEYVLVKKP